MKILHLDLKLIGDTYAEFRFFWDNPNDYKSRQLPLAEIAGLVEKVETDYYTRLPEDYAKTGQILYNWLDGNERNLQREIDKYWREGIVLAIAATEKVAHLPWEVLHDGKSFLVERKPGIVPIRWVKDENAKQLTLEDAPADRALNVLFMATSPRGIEPELDFEAEEAQVLLATKRQPLCLTVEESGCLTELGYLLRDYDQGHFDVVHLTGHATFRDEEPVFITETEFGEAQYSSAEDIASELQFQQPKLVFLSGCNTGYSKNEGAVPSMAEALLHQGATAVIGWGQRVRDIDATATSANLYQELSAGMALTQALALCYQRLLQKQARDWHLLRLYVAQTLPSALVKRGRKPVPRPSVASEFIDSEKKLRVATRETFVGRRRQLQNCLRVLKTSSQEIGVLIHGMGGLGKSTIAARLCDRLPEYEKLVWWRQIDESSLVNKLADKLKTSEQRTALRESTDELKYRLRDVLTELNQAGEKPFLLIFDDFEWNLEHRQGRYILKTQVAEVFKALVWAIEETYSSHRIIITCRYDFESDLNKSFYKQPLESLRKSDLQKKINRLEAFNSKVIEANLIERAKTLADGNPRLLEWLNDEILLRADAEIQLTQLEANSQDWRGRIVWEELYQQIDKPIEDILSQCLVFDIPVPLAALEAVCGFIADHKNLLNRAIELGLIEVSSETEESQRLYRVSRILPHIIPNIKLPLPPQVYSLYQKAHEILHHLWGNEDNESEEKWQEIFRLKFANKENPERFRQGFYEMLAVQYNAEADKAFEGELRRYADELVQDGLCTQLENYLQQQQWKEADEETAWIFYQVMFKENYKDWDKLLKNFPCETLREINSLWLENSNNNFGISIQAEIYQSLGSPIYGDSNWNVFGLRVGWKDDQWLSYDQLMKKFEKNNTQQKDECEMISSSTSLPSAALPVRIYTRYQSGKNFWFPSVIWNSHFYLSFVPASYLSSLALRLAKYNT
ncbi:CHAT domain-containing protein [Nostoc muscorum FACHB-395]|nr:CHAT domain-containing protein [Desmonostoc muscorum FACHB-395]